MATRDFYGYGENPPNANWPGGPRVAVSLVVNFEEGSELAVSRGDDRNEIFDSHEDQSGMPNLAAESYFEYGTRVGYLRIMKIIEAFGIPCTINACGEAVEISPWLGRDAVARGHEICCHGYRWHGTVHMTEEEERDWIRRAVAAIESVCGVRPVGYHGRNPISVNTRRLVAEEGGFLYDNNAYNDDLPYLLMFGDRQHVVIPYSPDCNDIRFLSPQPGFVRARDFADYTIDGFDRLWEEGAHMPTMLSVGVHLRISGRPSRVGGLEMILRHITQKGSVWFARRDEIARHWLRLHGRKAV